MDNIMVIKARYVSYNSQKAASVHNEIRFDKTPKSVVLDKRMHVHHRIHKGIHKHIHRIPISLLELTRCLTSV